MKQKTIDKFIEQLKDQIASGLTKGEFETSVLDHPNYFGSVWYRVKKEHDSAQISEELFDTISKLYAEGKKANVTANASTIDEERSKTEILEDADGKIIGYSFDIAIKDKPSLVGKFSRDEMNMIYRLYSSYGSRLSQREVSRFFPELSLYDFRRILKAFSITKASAQFAPHVIRENTEEQLLEMAYREKENSFLSTLEAEQSRKNANLVKEYFAEIQKLKGNDKRLNGIVEKFFNVKIEDIKHEVKPRQSSRTGIFHLADLHTGAKVNVGSLYDNEYNIKVLKDRLWRLSIEIIDGHYENVIINLIGDMLDGMDEQTCRRGKYLPQNMNNFEQVNNFLELMDGFFTKLKSYYDPKKISVFSVNHGNHDGITGYTAVKALFYKLQLGYGIDCTLFDKFFGHYKIGIHDFIICHGKDDQFMKRGLPGSLDDKTKVFIYDWLEAEGIKGKNIHFIKGDLHNDNINTSYKLDYRNVLSLFGASDYAMLNCTRSDYGVSYEVLENDNLLRGVLTNL
jgi:uncharacterized protein YdcH (DUF465 family)